MQFADLFLSVYVCLCVFDYRITRQLCRGEYASLVENGKEEPEQVKRGEGRRKVVRGKVKKEKIKS